MITQAPAEVPKPSDVSRWSDEDRVTFFRGLVNQREPYSADTFFSIIGQGLKDTNETVRTHAVTIVFWDTLATTGELGAPVPLVYDYRSIPDIDGVLLGVFQQKPEGPVGGMALSAAAILYPGDSAIERVIVDGLSSNPSDMAVFGYLKIIQRGSFDSSVVLAALESVEEVQDSQVQRMVDETREAISKTVARSSGLLIQPERSDYDQRSGISSWFTASRIAALAAIAAVAVGVIYRRRKRS